MLHKGNRILALLCAFTLLLCSPCAVAEDSAPASGGLSEKGPSPGPPPGKRLAFELAASAEVVPPERWVRLRLAWLWSRRLTEPPRPANV